MGSDAGAAEEGMGVPEEGEGAVMATEEPDSIGEGIDRSDRLIEGLNRSIEIDKSLTLMNPQRTYLEYFERVVGVLMQQQSLLVLLDNRITELDQRSEDA